MTALDDVRTVISDDDRGVSPPPGEQIDVRGLGSEGGVRLRGVPTLVRASRAVAVTITAGIAVSSFVLSFAALSDLARRTGSWADWLPYLWPGIVDGAIVLATMGILTTAAYPDQRKNRQFFWSMLALGSLVSIGGNALHAILPASAPLPTWLAFAVACVIGNVRYRKYPNSASLTSIAVRYHSGRRGKGCLALAGISDAGCT